MLERRHDIIVDFFKCRVMKASLEAYRRVAVSTERSKLVQKYVHGIKN
jgi:hypothetical protein